MLKQLAPIVLLFAAAAVQAEPVPLLIGGTTIRFPVEPGYVRVSQAQPKLFDFSAAALPPSNRLVEELAPAPTSRGSSRVESPRIRISRCRSCAR